MSFELINHSFEPAPLERINNSFELARELSLELELRAGPPSEADIEAAIHVMNQHLWAVKGDVPATLHTTEAYLNIPDSALEMELLPDSSLAASRVEKAILRGKIDSFKWIGSTCLSAFGIQMYGVDVIAPEKPRPRAQNAFLPIEAVGAQFSA